MLVFARSPRRFAAIASAAFALAGCTGPTVIRVIDGREQPGRFVSARAYALYARGAEAEARGDRASARLDYLAAAAEDDANVEIWTRIGAVSCALGRAADAQSAFDRAADRADDYEPLFHERAACTLASPDLSPASAKAAFEDAARALALDPNSEEAVLLYARAAEAAGETTRADRALRELVATSPGRVAGWRALRDFASRRSDTAAAARASAALDALGASGATAMLGAAAGIGATANGGNGAAASNGAGATTTTGATSSGAGATTGTGTTTTTGATASTGATAALGDVDAALSRDALDEARTAAKRARLSPAELAVRAAALGRAKLAKTQAELVHAADPTSASAAIALAVACDLLREEGGVVRALAPASALTTPPSPLARLLFAELVARRTDAAAARAWLGDVSTTPGGGDALLAAITARVAAQLAK